MKFVITDTNKKEVLSTDSISNVFSYLKQEIIDLNNYLTLPSLRKTLKEDIEVWHKDRVQYAFQTDNGFIKMDVYFNEA